MLNTKIEQRIRKACVYCSRSHQSCENARPCQRCISRGIGDKCHDVHRRKSLKFIGDTFKENSYSSIISSSKTVIPCISGNEIESPNASKSFMASDPLTIDMNLDLPYELSEIFSDLYTFTSCEFEDHFQKVISYLRIKLFSVCSKQEVDEIIENACVLHKYMVQTGLPTCESVTLYSKYFKIIEEQKEFFSKSGLPTIIWGAGKIHFISDSYKKLTGWEISTPASSDPALLLNEFSPSSCKMLVAQTFKFLTLLKNQYSKFLTVNVEVQDHKNNSFIQGTLHIRCIFEGNLPIASVGTFLPTDSNRLNEALILNLGN